MRWELRSPVHIFGADAASGALRAELSTLPVKSAAILVSASISRSAPVRSMQQTALKHLRVLARFESGPADDALPLVNEMADALQSHVPDLILAVGGGKVIDCAKALSMALARSIRFRGGAPQPLGSRENPEEREPWPSIVAVPTTLSGADTTPSAGLPDKDANTVMIADPRLMPRIAIHDARMLRLTPRRLLAGTAITALAHCVEVLYSDSPSGLATGLALAAARLLRRGTRSLATTARLGDDQLATLAEGATLAGIATLHARLGLEHRLARELRARSAIEHAQAHSALLAPFMRVAGHPTSRADRELAEALGDGGSPAWEVVADLASGLGVNCRLRDYGLEAAALTKVAEAAGARRDDSDRSRTVARARAVLEAAW